MNQPETLAKCPGCRSTCSVNQNDVPSMKKPATSYWVFCDSVTQCGYSSPGRSTRDEAIQLHNSLCSPDKSEAEAAIPLVEHNDELMGALFNITRSADSLDSSWLGKVRAAINDYIRKHYAPR